ncbi:hypothetical protein K523DRAFT_410689 [Schizophyllum commune Tattone D]|nr:hypothetical protein K523DRAFT_410689 [Schizophyllum commune Tattone D]
MNPNPAYSPALVPFRQILLLSDVDTTEHLSKHGISVVQHILAIGDRLVDHPIVDLHFKRKRNDSLKYYFLPSSVGEVFQLLPDAVRYALFGDGPMATNMSDCAAFIRLDDPTLLPYAKEKLGDALSAKRALDIEHFWRHRWRTGSTPT